MTYSTAEILLLHLLNLVKLRPLLKDSVWALHKRAREESLPVLQVAQHVVHVDDSVPDFAFICLPLLFPFNVDLKVVEVHASAHFLNVMHQLPGRRPREVGVMFLVFCEILFVELFRVFYGQNQVYCR